MSRSRRFWCAGALAVLAIGGAYLLTQAGREPVAAPGPPATGAEDALKARLYAVERQEGPEALKLATSALTEAQQSFSPDHSLIAEAAVAAASLQLALNQVGPARDLLQEALAARERAAGAGHWQARELRACLAELRRNAPAFAEAHRLHRHARVLFEQGRLLAAWGACNQALDRYTGAFGEASPGVAGLLLLKGQLAHAHGDHYPKARGLLDRAQDRTAAVLGEDHPAHADALLWLGMLEEERGDFFTANQHYLRSLAILKAARGERSREYARALNRQARMHAVWRVSYADGKVLTALQLREEVLGRDHPDSAESLQDLGVIALDYLNFDKAIRLLRDALARRRAALGGDHPDVAENLSCLGDALRQKGELTESHACHREALARMERACGGSHLRYARALFGYARLLGDQQDNIRAIRLLKRERAIRLRAGAERHPDYAECLAEMGTDLASCLVMNYLTYGDSQLASGSSQLKAQARRAESVLNEARSVLQRLPDSERLPVYSRVICHLGVLHYWTDYELKGQAGVSRLVEEARASIALHPVSPEMHPIHPLWLVEKGHLAEITGDMATAEQAFADLRRVVTQVYGNEHLFFTLLSELNTVNHYGRAGNWARLAPAAERAFDRFHGLLHRSALSNRATIEWLNILHRPLSEYALLAAAQPNFDAVRVYGEVLAFRGAMGRLQALTRVAHDRPEVRPKLEALRSAQAAFAEHALSDPPAGGSASWHQTLARLTDAKEDAETDYILACRPYVPRTKHDPVALARAVQQALPPGAVLVDFVKLKQPLPYRPGQGNLRWEMVLAAFVVHRDGAPKLVKLGPLAPIKAAVSNWRRDLQAISANERKSAQVVANYLWAPLSRHVGKVGALLLAPDGPVCLTPFAALPGSKPGGFLLEDFRISWLPAARSLAEPPVPAPTPARGLVVVGGIKYEDAGAGPSRAKARLSAPSLPGAGVEAEAVLRRFEARGESGRLLTKGAATDRAFFEALEERPRFIHFAGHGRFHEPESLQRGDPTAGLAATLSTVERLALGRNAMLRSGLLLAEGRQVPAEVLSTLDLRGTELVTLSACETGLGNEAGGEGPQGLMRAFLTAGSRSVISSLWKVEDAATNLLMEELYRNLWERSLSKPEALRQAQLTVLRHPDRVVARGKELVRRGVQTGGTELLPPALPPAKQTPPGLWAAFVLSGDGR